MEIKRQGKNIILIIKGQTFVLEGTDKVDFERCIREFFSKPNSNGKIKYADNVLMTPDERDKLDVQYGKENVQATIENMNIWKGMHGKTYKSDYMACIKWLQKESETKVESKPVYNKL